MPPSIAFSSYQGSWQRIIEVGSDYNIVVNIPRLLKQDRQDVVDAMALRSFSGDNE
jgi:hypothetical protein